MIVIVMGVTGCGKTTLGRALAERLNLPFYDADAYHPEPNRQKLAANIPLGDSDRLPWLALLSKNLAEWEQSGGAVLACSALKERYRDLLRSNAPSAVFIYLKADRETIAKRLRERAEIGHELIANFDRILDGQFRDLEEPAGVISLPAELPLEQAVESACAQLEQAAKS